MNSFENMRFAPTHAGEESQYLQTCVNFRALPSGADFSEQVNMVAPDKLLSGRYLDKGLRSFDTSIVEIPERLDPPRKRKTIVFRTSEIAGRSLATYIESHFARLDSDYNSTLPFNSLTYLSPEMLASVTTVYLAIYRADPVFVPALRKMLEIIGERQLGVILCVCGHTADSNCMWGYVLRGLDNHPSLQIVEMP